MLEIKKSIEQGFSGKPGGLYDILKQLQNVGIGVQGEVYFVDPVTGSDGLDGLSWETAFKTIARATVVSNAAQAAGYAAGTGEDYHRMTAILRGKFTESQTDFADRTDYIGVGSCDAEPRARIYGAHTATSVGGARFFNLEFMNTAATAIFTFTTCQGIAFHDCVFTAQGVAGTGTSYASYGARFLGAEGSNYVFKNCLFRPRSNSGKFSTAAIGFENTHVWNIVVQDCIIDGAIGIVQAAAEAYNCYITNNVIISTTLCIDDESDDVIISGNRMVSAAAQSTIGLVIDYNAFKAVDNILTGSSATIHCPAETA